MPEILKQSDWEDNLPKNFPMKYCFCLFVFYKALGLENGCWLECSGEQ